MQRIMRDTANVSISGVHFIDIGPVRWQNPIQGWLDVYAPEFRRVFKSWQGLAALWVLDTVPLPADVVALPFEELVQGLLGASHHRVGRKRAQALVTAARDSIGVPGAN